MNPQINITQLLRISNSLTPLLFCTHPCPYLYALRYSEVNPRYHFIILLSLYYISVHVSKR